MKLKSRIEQMEAKLMPQASVIYKHVRVEPDYEGPIYLHVEDIGPRATWQEWESFPPATGSAIREAKYP